MKFSFLVIVIALCSFTIKQSSRLRIAFEKKGSEAKADGFGNIYVVNSDEIIKYNPQAVLQKKFSTKRYGNIDFVDVTNPLKILVYYKDFQQILFLDNQLSASSVMISLETLGYEQTSLVCSSANNSFWIYNKQNNELLRFNAELSTMVKTGNLKRILDTDIKPNFMKEHNSYLYLNCPNEGILVFDMFGTFVKTIPIKQLKEFDVLNGNVVYFQAGILKEYQAQTFNTIEKPFSDTLLKTVYWQNNKFYKLYPDSLVVQ